MTAERKKTQRKLDPKELVVLLETGHKVFHHPFHYCLLGSSVSWLTSKWGRKTNSLRNVENEEEEDRTEKGKNYSRHKSFLLFQETFSQSKVVMTWVLILMKLQWIRLSFLRETHVFIFSKTLFEHSQMDLGLDRVIRFSLWKKAKCKMCFVACRAKKAKSSLLRLNPRVGPLK